MTDHILPRYASVDAMLDAARSVLRRMQPEAVPAALERGARLVDIRPQAQRAQEGELPGALVIERNVLEWRLDPGSTARIPEVTSYDQEWVIVCSEGYTSSLAAAALWQLGLRRATDVEGGFVALRDAGLQNVAAGGYRS